MFYSVSTNFRRELIEPSAAEVFIFWDMVEREERGASEWKGTLFKPSETKYSVKGKKNVDFLAYGSIKLVDTLYLLPQQCSILQIHS